MAEAITIRSDAETEHALRSSPRRLVAFGCDPAGGPRVRCANLSARPGELGPAAPTLETVPWPTQLSESGVPCSRAGAALAASACMGKRVGSTAAISGLLDVSDGTVSDFSAHHIALGWKQCTAVSRSTSRLRHRAPHPRAGSPRLSAAAAGPRVKVSSVVRSGLAERVSASPPGRL